MLNNTSFKE